MAKTAVDYAKHAPYEKTKFVAAYTAAFKGVPKFNAASIPDLLVMLEMMDPRDHGHSLDGLHARDDLHRE